MQSVRTTLRTLQWVFVVAIAVLAGVVGSAVQFLLAPGAVPSVPTGTNLLQDGAFDEGNEPWVLNGSITGRYADGTAIIRRNTEQGFAELMQIVQMEVPPFTAYTLQVQLSNPTPVEQEVRLRLTDPTNPIQDISCPFELPADATIHTYTVRGTTGTLFWNALQAQILLETFDNTSFPLVVHHAHLEQRPPPLKSYDCEVTGVPIRENVTYTHMAIVGFLIVTALRVAFDPTYDKTLSAGLLRVTCAGGWLWVALAVLALLSGLWAYAPPTALYYGFLLVLEVAMGLVIAVTARRGAVAVLCSIVLLAAVPHALIGIAQAVNGGTVGLYAIGERYFDPQNPFSLGPQDFRPYALATHPNVLAGHMALALMMGVVAVFMLRERRRVVLGLLLALAVVFAGLIVTVARMPLAITLAVMVPALLYSARPPRWVYGVLAALVVLGIAVIAFTPTAVPVIGTLAQRYRELAASLDGIIGRLMEGVPNTIAVFQDHPLLGVGSRNLYNVIVFEPPDRHGIHLPAHNVYVVVLAELGIIGGLLYTAGLLLPLRGLFSQDRVQVLLAATLLALALMILFEFLFWGAAALRPLTFVLLGMLWGLQSTQREGVPADEPSTVPDGTRLQVNVAGD